MKLQTNIVGLQYYGLHALAERLDTPEAQKLLGEPVFLTLDPQCAQDATAVMAWSATGPVGHVSCAEKWPYVKKLQERGCEMLETVVTGLDPIRRTLVVEPLEDIEFATEDATLAGTYGGWSYEGPVMLPPACLAQADHLMRMMERLATGKMLWGDTAKAVAEAFWKATQCDLTSETYQRRIRLAEALAAHGDTKISLLGQKLFRLIDHMGGKELIQLWGTEVLNAILQGPSACHLTACYPDCKADLLKADLMKFPHELGRIWLSGDRNLFVSRLYYAQLPRTMHLELFSLLVLYTAACYKSTAPAGLPHPQQPLLQLSMNTGQVDTLSLNNNGNWINTDRLDHLAF